MDNHYVYIQKECFICFTNECESQEEFVTLNTYNKIQKKCQCNPPIHIKCLETWLMTKNVCPICHTPIERKKTVCKKFSLLLIKICSHVETIFIFWLLLIILFSYGTHS